MNIDKKLEVELTVLAHIGSYQDSGQQVIDYKSIEKAKQSIKQLFQELIEEIIGEDENEGDARIQHYKLEPHQTGIDVPRVDFITRNFCKDEQRQRAKEIMENM